jgi:hypothetical protein
LERAAQGQTGGGAGGGFNFQAGLRQRESSSHSKTRYGANVSLVTGSLARGFGPVAATGHC